MKTIKPLQFTSMMCMYYVTCKQNTHHLNKHKTKKNRIEFRNLGACKVLGFMHVSNMSKQVIIFIVLSTLHLLCTILNNKLTKYMRILFTSFSQ